MLHDSSVEFPTSNANADFVSTTGSADIDGKTDVTSSDFGATGTTDIISSSDYETSSKADSHSDYDAGSFSSGLRA